MDHCIAVLHVVNSNVQVFKFSTMKQFSKRLVGLYSIKPVDS